MTASLETPLSLDEPILAQVRDRLVAGGALIPDTTENLLEVVGVLQSYGHVLDAYWRNLSYVADQQFLVLFPFFKYFNGDVTVARVFKHFNHDRLNYEFAEYCMKCMFWHGSTELDLYLDSAEFKSRCEKVIQAKVRANHVMRGMHRLFPDFLPEQVRQLVYYSALGQFWQVMSPMFLTLADLYDQGKIGSIRAVVDHVRDGLVKAANQPFIYRVKVDGQVYDLVPKSAKLTFLRDLAVPYVEAVFFRSLPFMGTVSYNAQARQISPDQADFNYGALYADPLPIGGPGIPPTLLMQDMRHFVPPYLQEFYNQSLRQGNDVRVQLCLSFQKSMFCVTTAAMQGLAPYPLTTKQPKQQQANYIYFTDWVKRLADSQLVNLN